MCVICERETRGAPKRTEIKETSWNYSLLERQGPLFSFASERYISEMYRCEDDRRRKGQRGGKRGGSIECAIPHAWSTWPKKKMKKLFPLKKVFSAVKSLNPPFLDSVLSDPSLLFPLANDGDRSSCARVFSKNVY